MNPQFKQLYDDGFDSYNSEVKQPREFGEIDEFFTKHNIEPEISTNGSLRITLNV
jgi:hypothetical protein